MVCDPSLPPAQVASPLSVDIDLAGPEEIVRILAACDRGLFQGPRGPSGVLAQEFLAEAWRAALLVRSALPGTLVLAGAGRAGRLAFLLARRFSGAAAARGGRLLALPAGGDLALARSQEETGVEAAQAGVEVSRALGPAGSPALFLGLSCGPASSWVSGGLLAALGRGECATLLFAPGLEDGTVHGPLAWLEPEARSAAGELLREGRASLLHPRIGPEALAGLSPRKGGAAAWVVLDAVLRRALDGTAPADLQDRIRIDLERKEWMQEEVHAREDLLASLVARAGRALRLGGSILPIGRGEPGLAGVLVAAEGSPAAGQQEMRAFLIEGWAGLVGAGERAQALERAWPLAWEWCRSSFLPLLGPESLAILLNCPATAAAEVRASGLAPTSWPGEGIFNTGVALSTVAAGAYVLAGKVFRNRIVDLLPVDEGRLEQAVRLVAELAGVGLGEARRAVAASIYGRDDLLPGAPEAPAGELAGAAAGRENVVPTALVMAAAGAGYTRAREALLSEPVIRRAIRRLGPGG